MVGGWVWVGDSPRLSGKTSVPGRGKDHARGCSRIGMAPWGGRTVSVLGHDSVIDGTSALFLVLVPAIFNAWKGYRGRSASDAVGLKCAGSKSCD